MGSILDKPESAICVVMLIFHIMIKLYGEVQKPFKKRGGTEELKVSERLKP